MNYIKVCRKRNLMVSKPKMNFIIFLHLYNIDQLNEWIDSLNMFYSLNKEHNISLYINIPIGENLKRCIRNEAFSVDNILIYDFQNCINNANIKIIKAIIAECILKIKIKSHFLVSENKGVDIGGFFNFLNIMKLKKIECDFLIKLHTKSKDIWRQYLCKILHTKYEEEKLRQYDMISSMLFQYPNPLQLYEKETNDFHIKQICKKFYIPYQETFRFVPGTIFMCSWKIVQQLFSLDLVVAYNDLNDINSKDKNWMRIMSNKIIFEHHCKHNNIDIDSNEYIDLGNNFALETINKTGIRDGQIEHAWERVFGLVTENLGSKFLIIN